MMFDTCTINELFPFYLYKYATSLIQYLACALKLGIHTKKKRNHSIPEQ